MSAVETQPALEAPTTAAPASHEPHPAAETTTAPPEQPHEQLDPAVVKEREKQQKQ